MNKENFLFSLCGFLLGIIAGTLFIGPRFEQARIARGAATAPTMKAATVAASVEAPGAGDPAVMEMVLQNVASLKKQLAANPADADAAVKLGNLYMDAGKYPQAISYYEQALRQRNDVHAATDLGICYRAVGDFEKALATFRNVQSWDPTHWQALFNEAVVLVDLRQMAEARSALERLKKMRPADPEIAKFERVMGRIR